MLKYGFDISELNPEPDWDEVKELGFSFCIVRCSYGQTSKDEAFPIYAAHAYNAGLKVGAYHYDYSVDVEGAIQNALNAKEAIEKAGVLLELPLFYDMEDADGWKERHGYDFTGKTATAQCKAFLSHIGKLHGGIYASYSWLEKAIRSGTGTIDWRSLNVPVWNAEFQEDNETPDTDNDDLKAFMWQWTDKYNIGGHAYDADIIY